MRSEFEGSFCITTASEDDVGDYLKAFVLSICASYCFTIDCNFEYKTVNYAYQNQCSCNRRTYLRCLNN